MDVRVGAAAPDWDAPSPTCALAADDAPLLDMIDQAVRNPVGRPEKGTNSADKPTGTTRAQALRKLRDDAPELHCEILTGRWRYILTAWT